MVLSLVSILSAANGLLSDDFEECLDLDDCLDWDCFIRVFDDYEEGGLT